MEPNSTTNEKQYVSTVQASLALGVSVTTVKRWVDDGILPAYKTAGGHRKVLLADVLRVVRQSNLPQADLGKLIPQAAVPQLSDLQFARQQLEQNMRVLDAEVVRGIIIGLYEAGHAIELLADQVIGPAMVELGRLWSVAEIDVMHEHRATQAIIGALYELRNRLKPPVGSERPIAVGGAPEGDPTITPTLLAKLTLCGNGWNAVNLGPHSPPSAFHTAIDELKPKLLWLCVTHIPDQERFVTDYAELCRYASKLGIPVAVGGRELTAEIRSRIPYTAFGDGMTNLASFARTLYQPAPIPKRGRPPKQA